MPRILASISAHGFGHMAISAPVLDRLCELDPECRITVSSSVAEDVLQSRIRCPFELVPDPLDFGLRMNRDLSVDVAATVCAYREIHADWEGQVRRRAEWLLDSRFDLVLANISCLNIAAAHRAGIPSIALAPLNWADLYRYFAPDTPASAAVFTQMRDAYNRSRVFLAPRPCMPMPNFHNVEVIEPIAQVGRGHSGMLRELFGLEASTKLLLLALGGQEADFRSEDLPVVPGTCWIADEKWGLDRDDILPSSGTGLTFPDLLASCDVLVGKPGYGAFVEAACLGKPVVYMPRPGWPEETCLIEWLERHLPCRESPRGDSAALESAIRAVMGAPPLRACAPDGIEAAVRHILAYLPDRASTSGLTAEQ
ncbi:MAG: hypothetical protein U5R46_20350 [Gammaproteobacteria bacterium]|nr:hypothetical protein [Gammaproteobacteria bacterium]